MIQTTTKTNQWFNENNSIEKLFINEVPKHRIYVDIFGNGGSVLMQKNPSKLEVFNDTKNKILELYQNTFKKGENVSNLYGVYKSKDIIERMKYVMIECVEFERLINIYDSKDTLFYVDLKNVHLSNLEQKLLAKLLHDIQGKAMIVIDEPTIKDIYYPDWSQLNGKLSDSLLLNFENLQMSLFTLSC